MMSLNYTYSFQTYIYWMDIIPCVLISPLLLHAAGFWFVCWCVHKFCIIKTFYKWVDDFFFDLLYFYTKVLFQNSLKKVQKHGTETPELRLHGYRLCGTLLQISSVTSLVVASSFFAFWDTFLIKQTFICDPQLVCFYGGMLLESCTYATENVVCFEFVYDIVGGFSSAIGVLGVSVLYFNMSVTVFFWFKKVSHTRLSKRWLKLCFSCFSHIVCCGQLIVNFSFISFLMYIPTLYLLTSDKKSSGSQELPNQTSLVIENQPRDSDSLLQDPPNQTSLVIEDRSCDSDSQGPPIANQTSLVIEMSSHSQHSRGPLNNEQSFDNETQSDLQGPIRHRHQDSPNNEVA